jgi:hypothetical protein
MAPAYSEFGIFEKVFQDWRGYLPLLNLSTEDAPESVKLVQRCCNEATDPFPDICHLLKEYNWRPHLVAAVAMINTGYQATALKLLWRLVDTGSWVTPQLGVALFLVDPDFQSQARIRLEAGCPIDVAGLIAMSPLERHSAAGPGGSIHMSAKAAATLLHLSKMVSPKPGWVEEMATSQKTRELLAHDLDESDIIAEGWLEQIKRLIDEDH